MKKKTIYRRRDDDEEDREWAEHLADKLTVKSIELSRKKKGDVSHEPDWEPPLRPIKLRVFMLESENRTGLGGAMGTERTWTNWLKHFDSLEKASAFAQKDFKRTTRINRKWYFTRSRDRANAWESPDLGSVLYRITEVEVL